MLTIRNNKKWNLSVITILGVLSFAICGCTSSKLTTYNHNQDIVNNQDPAVLFVYHNISVVEIDSVSTNYKRKLFNDTDYYKILLNPGDHILHLKYRQNLGNSVEYCGPVELKHHFGANFHYTILQSSGTKKCNFEIFNGGPNL